MLDVFAVNVQCKHVYFGCATTAAAISALDAYKYDPIIGTSITVMQSKPSKDPDVHITFEIDNLPSVFRPYSDAEPMVAWNGVTTVVNGNPPGPYIDEWGRIDEFPSATDVYARNMTSAVDNWNRTAGNRAKISPRKPTNRPTNKVNRLDWDSEYTILLNIHNERVDSDLGKIDKKIHEDFMNRYKNKKLCHFFHLLGVCRAADCSYSHQGRLSQEEIKVLRFIVRRLKCGSLSACRTSGCVYGHSCPYEKSGFCTKGKECPFKAVHGKDHAGVSIWNKGDPPAPILSEAYSSREDQSPTDNSPSTPDATPPQSPLPYMKQDKATEIRNGKKPAIVTSSSETSSRGDHVQGEKMEDNAGYEYKRYFTKRAT